MKEIRTNINLLVICLMCSAFLLGCEQVSAIKDYFSGDEKAANNGVIVDGNGSKKGKPVMTPDTIARVGSWTITKAQFQERIKALKEAAPDFDVTKEESRKLVLDELIRQQLLVIEAEKSGAADSTEIQEAVEEFKRTLIVREAAQKLVEGISVSQEEARDFYDKNKEQLVQPPQFNVSEIVVKDEETAETIVAELANGADFAEKAKEQSISQTAQNGGNVGFIDSVPFEAMAEVLMALEKDEVSKVVEAPTGEFYIIKLEGKKEGRPLVFEEVKQEIIQNQTLLKQQQMLLEKIEILQKEIKVEVNYDLLK